MQKQLPHQHITYLEADANYTVLHYRDGSRKMSGYNLGVFEEKLSAVNFRRIHRKYLVNDAYVQYRFSSFVLLKSGVELPVSRRRR